MVTGRKFLSSSSMNGKQMLSAMSARHEFTVTPSIIRRIYFDSKRRCQLFDENDELRQIRLYNSDFVSHDIVDVIDDKGIRKRPSCALCSGSIHRRNTAKKCSICQIPLCINIIPGTNVTCFEKWHSCHNLKQCSEQLKVYLYISRESNQNSRQAKASRQAGKRSVEARKIQAARRKNRTPLATIQRGNDEDALMPAVISPRSPSFEQQDTPMTSVVLPPAQSMEHQDAADTLLSMFTNNGPMADV